MNNWKVTLVSLASLFVFGCGLLPLDAEIKDGHARVENFKRDIDDNLEYVYLMCSNSKPIGWIQPRQFSSGVRDFWVKVKTSRRGIEHSERVAFVNLTVTLEAGKSYMLNREISNDEASLWFQEVDTGVRASNIYVTDLKRPQVNDFPLNVKQCQSETV